jgi:hypothetical protein
MMKMPESAIRRMWTGNTWNLGVLVIGGRCSKVNVSLPTTRAPTLIR